MAELRLEYFTDAILALLAKATAAKADAALRHP
jgi:hypothetical protein